MLFKKCSTSSEGCPEKFGKSSNRAFANNIWSAILFVSEFNVEFLIELVCEKVCDVEFVIIVCGINSV